MERKNNEKFKSHKIITYLNITQKEEKQDQNEDPQLQLQSGRSDNLTELNFDEKLKKLFDSKKFTIGNQFDQEGSEKFLEEKDECLKLMDLDDTILETKKKDKKKSRRKNAVKSKTEIKNQNHNLKYIPRIKTTDENIESFFSTESSKQIIKEFILKSNE